MIAVNLNNKCKGMIYFINNSNSVPVSILSAIQNQIRFQ